AIHEFGHFVAAKALGVRVNEFSIGMGPALISREKGETLYSLRAFPIGGYCAMEGEEAASDDPRSFHNKPFWKKAVILVAGAFLNFVTGLLLILLIMGLAGSPAAPVFTGVMEGAEAVLDTGLQPGDQFYTIDGHRIYFQTDALVYLERAGEKVEVTVLRDGERVDLGEIDLPYRQLTDENGQQVEKRGIYVGQFLEDTAATRLRNSWYQAIDYVRMVWMGLGDIVTGAMGLRDMSGVIGIVAMAGDVGQAGAEAAGLFGAIVNLLDFTALIAINLAVMNLLPIPALDGGQIFLLVVDGIYRLATKKHIDQKYLGYLNMAGFACLIALMILVAISDVNKFIL
uniref:M50 family metallopeptidase n=1 Tax=uncultured Flavonifractor sp. TaxID=1193534 RepID=UPI0026269E01